MTNKILLTSLMGFFTLTMLLPYLWMLSSSFKDSVSMFTYPIQWIPKVPNFSGYQEVWGGDSQFILFFLNSIKVTILAVGGTFLSCTLGGYAYAKINFKGRDAFFMTKLATMMIPAQVTMLPNFMIFKWLGLLDTHCALWLPFLLGQPFGTFLMRQYFIKVPNELLDSGRIDGAGHWKMFWLIALPLVQAGLSILVFLYFVGSWNYYDGPLIYIRSISKYTLPLAIKFYTDEYSTNYTAVLAASVSMSFPVIVVFLGLQRFFIEDITSTGVKG
jgi:multiple sugar transport system permease protein